MKRAFSFMRQARKILPSSKCNLYSSLPPSGTQWTWAGATQEDQLGLSLPLYWTTPLTIIPSAAPEVNATHSCYWGGIRLHVEDLQAEVTRGQEVVAFWNRREEGGKYDWRWTLRSEDLTKWPNSERIPVFRDTHPRVYARKQRISLIFHKVSLGLNVKRKVLF